MTLSPLHWIVSWPVFTIFHTKRCTSKCKLYLIIFLLHELQPGAVRASLQRVGLNRGGPDEWTNMKHCTAAAECRHVRLRHLKHAGMDGLIDSLRHTWLSSWQLSSRGTVDKNQMALFRTHAAFVFTVGLRSFGLQGTKFGAPKSPSDGSDSDTAK